MGKELAIKMSLYLALNDNETEEEVYDRFIEIMSELNNKYNICYQDYEHEVREEY